MEIPEGALVGKIDETEQDYPSVQVVADKLAGIYNREQESFVEALIDIRENIPIGLYSYTIEKDFYKMVSFMAYACEHPARRKRTPMDVEKMVEFWLPLIRQLAIAHDIDEKDAASSALDDMLLPVVSAPVSQIREFYRTLIGKMKEDKTIPWAVWRMFEFYGKNVLDKITNEQQIVLKKEIAGRIAERSVEQIPREDWVNSLIGALQWRDAETLEKVETALDAGEKPRIRGKQSCIFIKVGKDGPEVML